MREVMDSFNDPRVKLVVGVFSAQMAKTTAIENVGGYHVHRDPAPMMFVWPTLEIAEAMSKDRLAAMIRDTPALKDRFAEAGSKTSGDTLLHKKFPGGHWTLAGANSYNSLASRPIRIVIGDEAAKWKPNEKGSPFKQVLARIRTFWNGKAGFFSTPTDASPDNEFWQFWEQSDKRLFFIECPCCGEHVVLAFDETADSIPSDVDVLRAVLKWTEGQATKAGDGRSLRRAVDAWFECLECGVRIDDNERHRAVRSGHWQATQEFHGIAGFWGWTGMSPFVAAIFIANEWLGALGSPTALQSVKNETLGLPWRDAGEAPEWKRLFDRVEDYPLGTVPDGVLFLTAGVDVQADRLEIRVEGWGRGKQSWLVDYIVLDGDTSRPEVWRDLTKVIGTMYQHPSGIDIPIRKLAIDSGYESQKVYDWARQHKFGPVMVVKGGSDTAAAPVSAPSAVEITVGGKRMQTGIKVHLLNVGYFKSDLYGRLRLDAPNLERGEEYPDGYVHIPRLPDTEEHCRQLTAEQFVTRYIKGHARREWQKIRPRNEALDTWVYARAAAMQCGMDRWTEAQWAAMEHQPYISPGQQTTTPPAASAPKSSRNDGGWFGNRVRDWL